MCSDAKSSHSEPVCPHAAIRGKVYDRGGMNGFPATFKSADARVPEFKGLAFTLQQGARGLWWGLSAGLTAVAIPLVLRFLQISARPLRRL